MGLKLAVVYFSLNSFWRNRARPIFLSTAEIARWLWAYGNVQVTDCVSVKRTESYLSYPWMRDSEIRKVMSYV